MNQPQQPQKNILAFLQNFFKNMDTTFKKKKKNIGILANFLKKHAKEEESLIKHWPAYKRNEDYRLFSKKYFKRV